MQVDGGGEQMAEAKIALTIGEASEYTGIGRNCPESREKSPYQK